MAFFNKADVPGVRKDAARRAGLELCRGNVTTMRELLALCQSGPQKLTQIRNIGGKRAMVIMEICKLYQQEQSKEDEI